MMGNYDDLRDVIVIFIMPYDDGDRTIFLYTGGTKGHPTEQLRQLLHYMENSVAKNACIKELQELHKMVVAVKQDGEVGLAYMKSFEREERIRKQGLKEGLQEGKEVEIIKLGRKFGKSDAEILALLQEELQITEEQAKQVLEKYGKTLDL